MIIIFDFTDVQLKYRQIQIFPKVTELTSSNGGILI